MERAGSQDRSLNQASGGREGRSVNSRSPLSYIQSHFMANPEFNPDIPAANSPITSAELRANFNVLNSRCDELGLALGGRAGSVGAVEQLAFEVSDPPTQEQVQALYSKVNEMLGALQA